MIVNRFVMVYRKQTLGYQALAENLSEANQKLEKAQEEARRAEVESRRDRHLHVRRHGV